jgi:hypothetical protein
VWKFQGDREEEAHQYVERERELRKDQVLWICVVMETLYNMYAFWEGKGLLAGFRRAERAEKTYTRGVNEWNLSGGRYGKFILSP